MQTRIFLIYLLILNGLIVNSQSDFRFSYKYDEVFSDPIFSKIELISPNQSIYQLYADSASEYSFIRKDFFKEEGKYSLMVTFISNKYGNDTVDYGFEINGKEINVYLTIDFKYTEKFIKNVDNWIKGKNVPQGYIRLNKYYNSPKSIEISLNSEAESGDIQGPFFNIKNNSTDTIYGEYLPGYFWGKLFYFKPDSTLKDMGQSIDLMFNDSPPLYPDSIKLATVGSFGLYKYLPTSKYKYEILLQLNVWESHGIGVILDKSNFVWWGGTKNYYKLEYEFEVK